MNDTALHLGRMEGDRLDTGFSGIRGELLWWVRQLPRGEWLPETKQGALWLLCLLESLPLSLVVVLVTQAHLQCKHPSCFLICGWSRLVPHFPVTYTIICLWGQCHAWGVCDPWTTMLSWQSHGLQRFGWTGQFLSDRSAEHSAPRKGKVTVPSDVHQSRNLRSPWG